MEAVTSLTGASTRDKPADEVGRSFFIYLREEE
jgi:hypothetical protein